MIGAISQIVYFLVDRIIVLIIIINVQFCVDTLYKLSVIVINQ